MVRLLLILLLVSPVYAGDRGPKGDKGDPGRDGRDGVDCVSCSCDKNRYNLGGEVIWHEWDNHLAVKSGFKADVRGHGNTADIAILQWRFGKSPEDRKMEALQSKIDALEARLGARDTTNIVIEGQ